MADEPDPYSPIKPVPGKGIIFIPAGFDARVKTKAQHESEIANFLIDYFRKGDTTTDTIKAKAIAAILFTSVFGKRAGLIGFGVDTLGKGIVEMPIREGIHVLDLHPEDRIAELLNPKWGWEGMTTEELGRIEKVRWRGALVEVPDSKNVIFEGPGGFVVGPVADFQGLTPDEARILRGKIGAPQSRRILTSDDVSNMTSQAKEKAIKLLESKKDKLSTTNQELLSKLRYSLAGQLASKALMDQAKNLTAGFVTNMPMQFRDP